MAINKNSTGYTLGFAIVMVVIVAALLASLSEGLKEAQKENVDNEKRIYILAAAGAFNTEDGETQIEAGKKLTKKQIKDLYKGAVTGSVLNFKGESIDSLSAFDIDIVKEYKATKNSPETRAYPFFTYKGKEGNKYVVPMAGNGLWGPVWGYICLEGDQNTVAGVVFDHKSETPGLGAEITKSKFRDQFVGKKVWKGKKYEGISVVKGAQKKPEHQTDAIAGATITSKGVGGMLEDGFAPYILSWKGIEK